MWNLDEARLRRMREHASENRPDENGELVSPFYKNPVMWIGFAIPAAWSTLHGLYNYFPEIFVIAQNVDMLHLEAPVFRNTSRLLFYFRFNILGFFYFLKTEIAFSP